MIITNQNNQRNELARELLCKDFNMLEKRSLSDKETFYHNLLQKIGFQTVLKINRDNKDVIKYIGVIELGIISYQFLIHVIQGKEEITKIDLENLRSEKNPHTNKGLIITTSKVSKDAKKAKFQKDDISIDIIDKTELIKRITDLNIQVSD